MEAGPGGPVVAVYGQTATLILFRATHLGTPVPQSRARYSDRGRGVYHAPRSASYRRHITTTFCLAAGVNFETISKPVTVTVKVSGARACSDTDNHAKMVLDALQNANILADDSMRIVCRLVVEVWVDAPGPCTEVTIEDFDGVAPTLKHKRRPKKKKED